MKKLMGCYGKKIDNDDTVEIIAAIASNAAGLCQLMIERWGVKTSTE